MLEDDANFIYAAKPAPPFGCWVGGPHNRQRSSQMARLLQALKGEKKRTEATMSGKAENNVTGFKSDYG